MFDAAPAQLKSDEAPASTPARALIEEQLAMLTRLARVGMEIAEAVGREAVVAAAEPKDDSARRDPGLAFARAARAVRLTIALQSRLLKDLAELDRLGRGEAAAAKARHRMRLGRLTDAAAQAAVAARREAAGGGWGDGPPEAEIERLSSVAYERLTDAEDGDLWGVPFDEAVAAICADLALTPEWSARLAAVVQPPPGSRCAPLEPSSPLSAVLPPEGGKDPTPPPPIFGNEHQHPPAQAAPPRAPP